MFPSRGGSVPLHPEDQAIVDAAQEVCRELGITRVNPQTVTWVERTGLVRVPPDYVQIIFNNIKLPSSLKGRLDPLEWKGLIASALILYYKDYNKQMVGAMLTTVFPAIFLVPIYLIVIDRVLNLASLGGVLVIVAILPPMALVFFGMWRWFGRFKSIWFKADRKAAQIVGRENLLKALRKIEAMTSEPTGRGYHLAVPKVSNRIKQLELLSG